jgi:hypothetical protein
MAHSGLFLARSWRVKVASLREKNHYETSVDSRRFDGSLVNQHDRNAVADGIQTLAGLALQTLGIFAMCQGLPADRTDQDGEQIRGNHAGILQRGQRISPKACLGSQGWRGR